ncbi:arabinose-5-phosphate isomerase [Anseongella ginsenosidimutans]|uniref:Arabinose-5-phosphate isomerase n=1 Tax=Anseongella ginsenosidimutans TaxID=496056 RepID=A0A4R3KS74_9SPHI|nr:KpsF/GutQ family sugar-phosphate isomerase [Anseongella ginsenosidimutans]QEC53265.1 KpsF/GutQ family sugar-phosphate isomerase [Anseongella ginsenosidimutans]TCS87904.1 arabinose-5-phosphate isomerase [Anseongella ginsenosidimutans]
MHILESARRTLQIESEAILKLSQLLNNDFEKIVSLLLHLKGRVIVTGVGKSAIIAQKIVATFNSTGTPAIFMHAADAIHGDLGIIQEADAVLCISKSGNTPEIKVLVPLLKRGGNLLIAMVGELNSFLAREADYILNTSVDQEACPHNLAPTTSTTAQLAMGDALAICLLEQRNFGPGDFAHYHPGGALGKKLYLKVGDIAKNNEKPSVAASGSIREVIMEISSKRLGMVAVMENGELAGIITDGDLRRMMEKTTDLSVLKARDIMSLHPKTIDWNEMAVKAVEIIKKHSISALLVTKEGKYAGVVHFHDLIKEGII